MDHIGDEIAFEIVVELIRLLALFAPQILSALAIRSKDKVAVRQAVHVNVAVRLAS